MLGVVTYQDSNFPSVLTAPLYLLPIISDILSGNGKGAIIIILQILANVTDAVRYYTVLADPEMTTVAKCLANVPPDSVPRCD